MKAASKLFSFRQSEIFDSFNPVELGKLMGIFEELELPKHHVLFSPGAPCEAIYFIEEGRVRLTRLSPEGKTVILAFLDQAILLAMLPGKAGNMIVMPKRLKIQEFTRLAAKHFKN